MGSENNCENKVLMTTRIKVVCTCIVQECRCLVFFKQRILAICSVAYAWQFACLSETNSLEQMPYSYHSEFSDQTCYSYWTIALGRLRSCVRVGFSIGFG